MPRDPVVQNRATLGTNVLLWLVQALLALLFFTTGFMKLSMDPGELVASRMLWAERIPLWLIRVIGVLEILGATGLILPSILRVAPRLTALAAACLALLMVVAGIEHAAHGELRTIPTNLLILALALFVAWGRGWIAPILPRDHTHRHPPIGGTTLPT